MNTKYEKLKTILELLKNETLTPNEVKGFLDTLITTVQSTKKEFETLSKENIDIITEAIEYIQSEHANIINYVSGETKSVKKELADTVKQLKKYVDDNKPEPVVIPTIEEITDEVMSRLPEPEPVKEITSKEVRDKLETLNGDDRLDKSAVKGIETLEKEIEDIKSRPETGKGFGSMIKEAPKDGKTYGRNNRQWVEVTGGDVQSVNDVEPDEAGNIELDTDDIDEGATNKYFTDQRAIDALTDDALPNTVLYRDADGIPKSNTNFNYDETNDIFEVLGLTELLLQGDVGLYDYRTEYTEVDVETGGGTFGGLKSYVEGEDSFSFIGVRHNPLGGTENQAIMQASYGVTLPQYESEVSADPQYGTVNSYRDYVNGKELSIKMGSFNYSGGIDITYDNLLGTSDISHGLFITDLGVGFADWLNGVGYYLPTTQPNATGQVIKNITGITTEWADVLEIGNTIGDADPNSILFTDDDGKLRQDPNFTRDEVGNTDIVLDLSGNIFSVVNREDFLFDAFPFAGVYVDDGAGYKTGIGVANLEDIGAEFRNVIYAIAGSPTGESGLIASGELGTFTSNNNGDDGVDLVEYRLTWSGVNEFAGFSAYDDILGFHKEFGISQGAVGFLDVLTDERYYLPTTFPTADGQVLGVLDYTTGETGWITAGGGAEWEVVSSNTTASNDGQYTVVATATFTDPTPAEGKGFEVFVRNGTVTVGGTAYAIAGTTIRRVYHSGSWANYTNIDNLFQIFIDLVNYDNSTLKAPVAMKINSVSEQSGSTTILVNASAYTLGNSISQYDSIKVTNAVGSLVTLNCEKI